MECLACGDCCLRMSPLSSPEPCKHIEQVDDIYLCKIYENRPEQCKNHSTPHKYCPIGVDKLKLITATMVHRRLDDVWELINHRTL